MLAATAVFGAALTATSAVAQPLSFSYTPTSGFLTSFSFTLDTTPTPFTSGPSFFGVASVPLTKDGTTSDADLYFFTDGGGGMSATLPGQGSPFIDLQGDLPFFTGTTANPVFVAGTYLLHDAFNEGSLTISAVGGPVPEPETWAMMLIGFGAVGYSIRRRKRAARQFA